MKTLILSVALAAGLSAQGRLTSGTTETRKVTQALDREASALEGRRTDLWAAYTLTTPASTRRFCGGSHVALESSSQITVMMKMEGGALRRIRVFTPECDVDTGTVPLIRLEGVTSDDSAEWLYSLIRQKTDDRTWRTSISDPALNALSFHGGDRAVRHLISLARDDGREDVRRRALTALGDRAGQQAVATISAALDRDPEIEVKKTAVAALARLPKDDGIPLLIQVARTNKNPELRREAMTRLGQTNDPRAIGFFEEILK